MWAPLKGRAAMKKLVFIEMQGDSKKEIEKDVARLRRALEAGDYSYGYFKDLETGKYYNPINGYTVTGEDLSKQFVEVVPVD